MRVPPATWVLAAFLAVYLLFFVYPTFSGPVMRSVKSVPAAESIGGDLEMVRSFSASWLHGGTPYTGLNIYPPLTAVVFAPLALISGSAAFRLMTLCSVAGFLLLTLVLPLRHQREFRLPALPVLIAATGLVSYGFQLELERGQFNVISIALCCLSIWIFHHWRSRRVVAYALFVLSVQLKIYPLIFALMLVDDWRDWPATLKRWAALGAVNVALLLALGPTVSAQFLAAMTTHVADPGAWVANHSIRSYTLQMAAGSTWLEPAGLIVTVACLGMVLLKAIRRNAPGINAELLLACTLAALLIPPVSHDYKLALVAAPLSLLFADDGASWRARAVTPARARLVPMLMFALSAIYAATLVSYDYRPAFIDNSFPMVMAMLVLTAALSVIMDPVTDEN